TPTNGPMAPPSPPPTARDPPLTAPDRERRALSCQSLFRPTPRARLLRPRITSDRLPPSCRRQAMRSNEPPVPGPTGPDPSRPDPETYNVAPGNMPPSPAGGGARSEEHTSELQSRENLVCRLL